MLLEDTTKVQKFFKKPHSIGKIPGERKTLLIAIAEKTHRVLLHTQFKEASITENMGL